MNGYPGLTHATALMTLGAINASVSGERRQPDYSAYGSLINDLIGVDEQSPLEQGGK